MRNNPIAVRLGAICRLSSLASLLPPAAPFFITLLTFVFLVTATAWASDIPSRARGYQYARDIPMLYLTNGITTARGMLVPHEQRSRFLELRRILIRELQDSGAGLLLGSNAPQIMNVPGFSIHEELVFLVTAGLTPLQALQGGTFNVARFLGDPQSGEVRQGFKADLLLLKRNPLENISSTGQILGVFRAGIWYSRENLDKVLSAIRNRGI